MTAEQVIRCAILKSILDCDYRELAFHLQDSAAAQWFSRLPYGRKVDFRTLQQNIKRIQASTWEKINQVLVRYAKEKGIEKGKKIRSDCTVVEASFCLKTALFRNLCGSLRNFLCGVRGVRLRVIP
jgi:IS5 family transposase